MMHEQNPYTDILTLPHHKAANRPHMSMHDRAAQFSPFAALTGFDGVIRPDHGRMIWNEQAMPGYGLYDRALGACYLSGLWEAVDKAARR